MYSFFVKLVARSREFCRMAYPDYIERNPFLGQVEDFRDSLQWSFLGVNAAPDRAKTEIRHAQEYVFGSGGAILYPKLAQLQWKRA